MVIRPPKTLGQKRSRGRKLAQKSVKRYIKPGKSAPRKPKHKENTPSINPKGKEGKKLRSLSPRGGKKFSVENWEKKTCRKPKFKKKPNIKVNPQNQKNCPNFTVAITPGERSEGGGQNLTKKGR